MPGPLQKHSAALCPVEHTDPVTTGEASYMVTTYTLCSDHTPEVKIKCPGGSDQIRISLSRGLRVWSVIICDPNYGVSSLSVSDWESQADNNTSSRPNKQTAITDKNESQPEFLSKDVLLYIWIRHRLLPHLDCPGIEWHSGWGAQITREGFV